MHLFSPASRRPADAGGDLDASADNGQTSVETARSQPERPPTSESQRNTGIFRGFKAWSRKERNDDGKRTESLSDKTKRLVDKMLPAEIMPGETRRRVKATLQRAPAGELLYAQGVGVSQTTYTKWPWRTVVRTAEPKFEPRTGKEKTRPPAAPGISAQAKQRAQQEAKEYEGPVSDVYTKLSAPEALEHFINLEGPGGCFRGPSPQRQGFRARMKRRMGLTGTSSPAPVRSPEAAELKSGKLKALLTELQRLADLHTLSGAESVLLAKTLDVAFSASADPVKDSLEALRELANTDLLRNIRDVGETRADGGKTPAAEANASQRELAWKLAQHLERVPGGVGMDLLDQLTPHSTTRSPDTHPSVANTEKILLRVYLKASSELAAEKAQNGFSQASDPHSVYGEKDTSLQKAIKEVNPNWPGDNQTPTPAGIKLSVAEKALLALKSELRGIDLHAANTETAKQPYKRGKHGCLFAIPRVRGNMATDQETHPDGTPGEFMAAEKRAKKGFVEHPRRARENASRARLPGSKDDSQSGPFSMKSLSKAVLRETGFVHKSPFDAYNKVTSKDGLDEGLKFPQRSSSYEGEQYRHMIMTLKTETDARLYLWDESGRRLLHEHGKIDPQRLEDDQATLTQLVRQQILNLTLENTRLIPRFANPMNLPPTVAEAAVNAIMQQVDPDAPPASVEHLRQRVVDMVKENQPLTAQRLLEWAEPLGGPKDAQDAKTMSQFITSENWKKFVDGFEAVANNRIVQIDMPSFEGIEHQAQTDMIAELVRHERLGSSTTWESGGTAQANTKSAVGIATSVALLGTANVRGAFGGGVTRSVTFASGTSTPISSVSTIAARSAKYGDLGAGGSVGHSFGEGSPVNVTLSVGADVASSRTKVHREGVEFGFPRHISGGTFGDENLNVEKARLVQRLMCDPKKIGTREDLHFNEPANPEDRHALINLAYHEFPYTLSINRVTQDSDTTSHTAGPTAGAGARVSNIRVGLPNVSAPVTKSHEEDRFQAHSGWLRTERSVISRTLNGSLSGVGASIGSIENIAKGSFSGAAMSTLTSAAEGSVRLLKRGEVRTLTRILEDGSELQTSFVTDGFVHFAGFLEALEEEKPGLALDKATMFASAQFKSPESFDERFEREIVYLDDLTREHLASKDMTVLPSIYRQIKQKALGPIHKLDAEAYLSEQRGDHDAAMRARTDIESIHANNDNFDKPFVIFVKTRSQTLRQGPNNLLGVTVAQVKRASETNTDYT